MKHDVDQIALTMMRGFGHLVSLDDCRVVARHVVNEIEKVENKERERLRGAIQDCSDGGPCARHVLNLQGT